MELTKSKIAVAVLVIFHLVGIVGLLSPYKELILSATALHLLVVLVYSFGPQLKSRETFSLLPVSSLLEGWTLEWVGVNTGFPFGAYHYGKGLGWGVDDIPFMIGVNWLLLVYSVTVMLRKLPLNRLFRALLGAVIMVSLDFLIEPLTAKLDYWYWETGEIPTANYWGWLGYSFYPDIHL